MSINRSFTLIELLVVIAIVGILSGLIIVSLNGATVSAQDARTRAGIDSIRKTILAYGIHSGGVYPTETCVISSTTCPLLTSALVPDYYSALPDTIYSYTSSGTDFTVSAVLSNSDTYSYTASTGFLTTPLYFSSCWTGDVGGLTCTETYYGSYVINTIILSGTTTGTNIWNTPGGVTEVEYLVVAGGGGGSGGTAPYSGGGGGAGGLLTLSDYPVSGTLDIIVGSGGTGGTGANSGTNGNNSRLGDIITIGGGAGGYPNGLSGGSGGGGKGYATTTGGSGTSGQGNNGGAGATITQYYRSGGGGGGASLPGNNGYDVTVYGHGGDGLTSLISSASTVYAGGGAGGTYATGAGPIGGAGGGGNGGYRSSGHNNGSNATGYGSGGGGGAANGTSNTTGGNGSSGIVIIRYLHP
jgi:prepilin-type N-terminal cleavage/methylation domain-containing protein